MRLPILLCLGLAIAPLAARGQGAPDGMAARLSAEKVSDITPGLYTVDDGRSFVLTASGDKLLLRFQDAPETFVLTVERASLGAKVLKYDTGATALRVSVWGGLTLYTQADPSGVPATRQGEAPADAAPDVSVAELNAALEDEGAHINYVQKIALRFSADPGVMGADDATRAAAFGALTNTARGIERFLAAPAAHKAVAGKLDAVRIVETPRPQVTLNGHQLVVGFAPALGPAGCASSHAVAHALGKLFAVATPE